MNTTTLLPSPAARCIRPIASLLTILGMLVTLAAPVAAKADVRRQDFALMPLVEGGAVAWNSCATIGYRVNLNGMPKAELHRVRQAFRRIESVTALRFHYEGSTPLIPLRTFRQTDGQFDDRTDITVAFARAGRKPRQAPVWIHSGMLGFGGPSSRWSSDGSPAALAQGHVLFNADGVEGLPTDSRLALYMHELGHVMGLEHARRPGQIMFAPLLPSQRPRWGSGDRAGLHRLGYAGQPCR